MCALTYDVMTSISNLLPLIRTSHTIQGNSSPGEHAKYVWNQFVKESKAKRIDIVAHSYGGVVTVDLVRIAIIVSADDSIFLIHTHIRYRTILMISRAGCIR